MSFKPYVWYAVTTNRQHLHRNEDNVMAFQPAQNALKVEMNWVGPGGLYWQNVLHFTKTDFDEDDVDLLLAIMALTYANSDLITKVVEEVSLGSLVGTDIRTQGSWQRELIVGDPGENIGDMAAQGAALVATLRTDLRGRSYRGRFYMCGIADSELVDGAWIIGTASDVTEFLQQVADAALTIGFVFVVLSRWLNEVERLIALGQEITSIVVRSLAPGSQRRRNRRG